MLAFFRRIFSAPSPSRVRASYDNARTSRENAKHWAPADALSAKAAHSPAVRRTLRLRSRYEIANSPYLRGIVETKSTGLIGTGPTAQVQTGDDVVDRAVETAWAKWAAAVSLREKLTTASKAKIGDGEAFLVLANYDRLDNPVKLYPLDVETDQVATPSVKLGAANRVDGLVLDEIGRPLAYDVLTSHPGDLGTNAAGVIDSTTIRAASVIHWFRKDRPGQVRGVPEISSALDLFAELRRYRRAVLAAAETAASVSAYLEGSAPPSDGDDERPEDWKTFQIERDVILTLPAGTKIAQIDAKQPSTTFDAFSEKLLAEACRCIDFPLNLALGTSQKFNFSSARLDHLQYHASLRVERRSCEETVLRPMFAAWLNEAVMVPGVLPDGIDIEAVLESVEWYWPGFPWMDPLLDAQADTERLTVNRTKTYRQHFAEQGRDWKDEFAQLAAEKAEMARLGITPAEVAARANGGGTNGSQTETDQPNAVA